MTTRQRAARDVKPHEGMAVEQVVRHIALLMQSGSLKPGDQLKMTIWPSRETKTGGVFYAGYTTFRDGRAIGGN